MRTTPVWTDPDFADLLATDPELVAIADAVQQTRAARPARRRRLRAVRFPAAAAASAAATAIVLLAPWNGNGQAAVLERLRSALSPKPGWILHERALTTEIAPNGRPVTVVSESWIRDAPPYPFRELIRRPGSPVLAVSGTATTARGRVAHDPAGDLRRAVTAGAAAIAGDLSIGGRRVLRIVSTEPQRYGFWIAYVDATTFRPTRFELSGPPARGRDGTPHSSTSVIAVTEYGYLPPTTRNLRLANLHRSGS